MKCILKLVLLLRLSYNYTTPASASSFQTLKRKLPYFFQFILLDNIAAQNCDNSENSYIF